MVKKITGGNPFLKSRTILYIFLFLALFDLYNHLLNNDTKTLFVMIISGYITFMFSENMIVILTIALVVSNIFKAVMSYNKFEGFRENSESGHGDTADIDALKNIEESTDTDESPPDTGKQIEESEKLVSIQKQLLDNMKQMAPLLKEMQGFTNQTSNIDFSSKQMKDMIQALEGK